MGDTANRRGEWGIVVAIVLEDGVCSIEARADR